VKRYPQMKYQVARACAVAGYDGLYKELDDIAEEARECGNLVIYELIMANPVRYEVMNDYARSVHTENPPVAYLNGGTAVCWMLDSKQGFRTHMSPPGDDDDDSSDYVL